jgi:hypothetical protein
MLKTTKFALQAFMEEIRLCVLSTAGMQQVQVSVFIYIALVINIEKNSLMLSVYDGISPSSLLTEGTYKPVTLKSGVLVADICHSRLLNFFLDEILDSCAKRCLRPVPLEKQVPTQLIVIIYSLNCTPAKRW